LHASGRSGPSAPAVSRTGLAAALTLFAVAFGVGLLVFFGSEAIPVVIVSNVVPLTLLWLSADVARADEQASGG